MTGGPIGATNATFFLGASTIGVMETRGVASGRGLLVNLNFGATEIDGWGPFVGGPPDLMTRGIFAGTFGAGS
jgi:hypothetical protein